MILSDALINYIVLFCLFLLGCTFNPSFDFIILVYRSECSSTQYNNVLNCTQKARDTNGELSLLKLKIVIFVQ